MFLTIQLNNVEPDALRQSAAAGSLDNVAGLDSLAQVVLQDEVERSSDEGEDNGENTETPFHANLVENIIGSLGTSKCSDDVGRGGEGVCETSTFEHGRIGSQDINGIGHTTETESVEDL